MPPLLDEDDVTEKKTDKPGPKERMAEKLEKIEKAKKGEFDTDEDAPVIDVSERDEDDEPEEAAPRTSVRQEKKRNRYREMSERAAAAERSRQETEARFSQMLSLYERAITQQQKPQTPEKDEFDQRLENIYREQETLYTELQVKANRLTQADKDRIEKRAKELDAEKITVTVQKQLRAAGGMQQGGGQADTMQAILAMEYPDVTAHEDALGWAQGYYQMQRREGRQGSIDLAREAMTKARQRFRMGASPAHRPPPAMAARDKYAGTGAGGSGSYDPDDDREQIVMNKAFQKMASAKYPLIKDEKKRLTMWAQGPGKRLLQAQRQKHGV